MYNLTGKWNVDSDLFQVLIYCTFSNFGTIEKYYEVHHLSVFDVYTRHKYMEVAMVATADWLVGRDLWLLSETYIAIFYFFKKKHLFLQ